MINLEFYKKMERILKNRVKGSRFFGYMMGNLEKWENLTLKEIEDLIYSIKDENHAIYAFLPFCYKILGINMFDFYHLISQNEQKNITFSEKDLEMYPIQFHQLELDYLKRSGISLSTLKKMRDKLIEEGAKGVSKIQVIPSNEWISFDDL